MEKIELVKYRYEDYEYVYDVKKNAYKKYVEECWGSWNECVQQEYFKKFINTYKNSIYIIKLNDKNIGFYNDYEAIDYYEIGNICIVPEYQGKGIGTMILNQKINEHKDKDIKIQYFKQNPVGKLYKKMGFIINGETEFHYQMVKKKCKNELT